MLGRGMRRRDRWRAVRSENMLEKEKSEFILPHDDSTPPMMA
jgi:hypothetical protein